jgi:hypothetical protein
MSGQCKHCGHDGCVCDNDLQTIPNDPFMTDDQDMTDKPGLMTDRLYKTKQSRLKYNTLTKQNNEQTN